ncbi:MAG: hypothetical protein AAF304_02995 [Pseudomonadota bacterium]
MKKQVQKVANPQGKGIAGVVEDLRFYAPSCVQAKDGHQWLAEYFTSILVLGAKYSFKPTLSKNYYLYFKSGEWKLSLIEPHAWKSYDPGAFFASCILNRDMSWSMQLAEDWHKDPELLNEIREQEQAFLESMQDETPLVEKLPFFIQSLSYYQRLGANALARSLQRSLELQVGNDKSLEYAGTELLAGLLRKDQSLLESIS